MACTVSSVMPPPAALAPRTGHVQAGLGLLGRLDVTADGVERIGRAPLSFEREGAE